jgi:hypothetical protein
LDAMRNAIIALFVGMFDSSSGLTRLRRGRRRNSTSLWRRL